jgi:hypothetical protein
MRSQPRFGLVLLWSVAAGASGTVAIAWSPYFAPSLGAPRIPSTLTIAGWPVRVTEDWPELPSHADRFESRFWDVSIWYGSSAWNVPCSKSLGPVGLYELCGWNGVASGNITLRRKRATMVFYFVSAMRK